MGDPYYSNMTIRDLASVIREDWSGKGKGVSPHALPYLDAMGTLTSISDNYMFDSGESVIRYFLCNAAGWRGDVAKAVKAELKARLG